jgi:hypothetical protein
MLDDRRIRIRTLTNGSGWPKNIRIRTNGWFKLIKVLIVTVFDDFFITLFNSRVGSGFIFQYGATENPDPNPDTY